MKWNKIKLNISFECEIVIEDVVILSSLSNWFCNFVVSNKLVW